MQSAVMPEALKIALLDPLLRKVKVDWLSKLVEKAVFVELKESLVKNELHEVFQLAYKSFHVFIKGEE